MRLLKKVGLGAAGLVLISLAAHQVHVMTHHPVSAAQRVAAHPMPTLFSQAAMTPYAAQLDRQGAEATQLMQGWWRTHDTQPDDKKFVAWLEDALPAPPNASTREAEAKQLEKLAKTHTASGTKAAHWLQTYGGGDLWHFYLHQQTARLTQAQESSRNRQLTHVMAMAQAVGRSVNKRLQLPAPSLVDPALGRRKSAPAGKACPCSYPAGADAAGAAGRTFLGYLYPRQAPVYKNITEELGFAQVYLGNHLPSDVDAGSLIGDMVGEYFLVTQGEGRLQQVTATLAGQ